jgi:hypothetical protein
MPSTEGQESSQSLDGLLIPFRRCCYADPHKLLGQLPEEQQLTEMVEFVAYVLEKRESVLCVIEEVSSYGYKDHRANGADLFQV